VCVYVAVYVAVYVLDIGIGIGIGISRYCMMRMRMKRQGVSNVAKAILEYEILDKLLSREEQTAKQQIRLSILSGKKMNLNNR
jgi:hypothetical protein